MSKALENLAAGAAKPIGIAVAVLGVGALVWFIYGRKVKAAAAAVVSAVNPASDKNLVYNGVVGTIGRTISGDETWSLGGWLYDVTHKDYDPNAPTSSAPTSSTLRPRSVAVREEASWYENLIGD